MYRHLSRARAVQRTLLQIPNEGTLKLQLAVWNTPNVLPRPVLRRRSLRIFVKATDSFTHIIALSTMAGKNFIGRLGAELDCAPVTDILEVVDEETFVRPMYAGNAVATVRAADSLKILTVRPTSFEKAAATGGTASVESAPAPENGADAGLASFVSESVSGGDRPDLTAARVVVSGGRGMKDGDNFKILEKLADKLGGAVGASRAAVDAGFVANELQVTCRRPTTSSCIVAARRVFQPELFVSPRVACTNELVRTKKWLMYEKLV